MLAESTPPTVHLVCKTHLDLGFTDLAAAVRDRYVDEFIPSALAVAAELRAEGGPQRFVWTTGSWLVDTFLERSDAAGRRGMEDAIEAGDIAWHALPFTLHSELCDRSLFEHGLSISARLDARFGRRTIAAKMTDVPGHTRGIVPLLAAAGVEFLHIGVNPACPIPEVPPVFRWRSPDGAEIVVAYQSGGYGGAVTVDGLADQLVVAHTNDNEGPQTAAQVRDLFGLVQASHPELAVVASTLDAFAVALRSVRDELPVVTQELGDTWIHGVGTDPQKVARFRELTRLRARWIAGGADATEPAFAAASTSLLLVAEHTWGLDEKITLGDEQRYRAEDLAELRSEPAGRRFESSWAEQADYIDAAVAMFPEPFRAETAQRLRQLDLSATSPFREPIVWDAPDQHLRPIRRSGFEVVVDPETGALRGLTDVHTGRAWADADHQLGRYRYQTFDAADYDRFHAGYNQAGPDDEWWALRDFTKPGIDRAGAVSRWWEPSAVRLCSLADGDDGPRDRARHAGEARSKDFGCPPVVTLEWRFFVDFEPTVLSQNTAELTIAWATKPACRMPEAGWLSFRPIVADPARWVMDKVGQDVSPLQVVSRGNRHLHAVGRGVRHEGEERGVLRIDTAGAPLVAPRRAPPAGSTGRPARSGRWHAREPPQQRLGHQLPHVERRPGPLPIPAVDGRSPRCEREAVAPQL